MAQRHMDRLTSFDTSFLTNEKSNGHMAIGAIMVCEGSAPSYEDFVTHIRSRLHLLPRLRQRLAVPPLQPGHADLGRRPRLRRPQARPPRDPARRRAPTPSSTS